MASSASSTGPRPVIGLTTYCERASMRVWEREFAMLHASYVEATSRAGGIAVLLPPQQAGVEQVLDRVDALVLTGGADVDPLSYGEAPARHTSAPSLQRDAWELALAREAVRRDIPLLAICRGLQILNVALGGSLHQHLPDLTGHERHQPAPGVFGTMEVNIEPGTLAAGLLGPRAEVSCHHHQAVARLAPALRVTGRADDGTVEAAEVSGSTFVLGVQWHPEERREDIRLFSGLVAAGQRDAQRRRQGVP